MFLKGIHTRKILTEKKNHLWVSYLDLELSKQISSPQNSKVFSKKGENMIGRIFPQYSFFSDQTLEHTYRLGTKKTHKFGKTRENTHQINLVLSHSSSHSMVIYLSLLGFFSDKNIYEILFLKSVYNSKSLKNVHHAQHFNEFF